MQVGMIGLGRMGANMVRLPQWIARWLRRTSPAMVLLAASTVRSPAQQVERPARVAVLGSVRDTISGSLIRLATVRVVGTSLSVVTDDAGHFRIAVPLGQVALKCARSASCRGDGAWW